MIQTFGGFLVSLMQQQLSEELLLVFNPLQKFDGGGGKFAQQIN
jgi:hypothetical protein